MSDTKPLRFSANGTPTRKRRRRSSPLVVDAKRLAKLLGCAVRSIRTWDAAGKLPMPLRLGGRVVWRVAEIRAWLDAGAPDRETWTSIRDARLK